MDIYDSSAEGRYSHCSTVIDDITSNYLQLIQVKNLEKKLNAGKSSTQFKQAKSTSLKASNKVLANLEAEVKKAAQARENAIETA
jgi:hypothetical protein